MSNVIALVLMEGTLLVRMEKIPIKDEMITLEKKDVLNQKSQDFKTLFSSKGLFKKPKQEILVQIRESTSQRSFEGENFPAFTAIVKEKEKNNEDNH